MMYNKVVFSLVDLPFKSFFMKAQQTLPTQSLSEVVLPKGSIQLNFLEHVIKVWNRLSEEVLASKSASMPKNSLISLFVVHCTQLCKCILANM